MDKKIGRLKYKFNSYMSTRIAVGGVLCLPHVSQVNLTNVRI